MMHVHATQMQEEFVYPSRRLADGRTASPDARSHVWDANSMSPLGARIGLPRIQRIR